MKSKEERFLDLISCIDINNPVMDYNKYGHKLFWFDKEGKYICHYNMENETFWFSYDKVWSVLAIEYGLNYTDEQIFMWRMVEEYFKIKVETACKHVDFLLRTVEEHFKMKGTPTHLNQ